MSNDEPPVGRYVFDMPELCGAVHPRMSDVGCTLVEHDVMLPGSVHLGRIGMDFYVWGPGVSREDESQPYQAIREMGEPL